MNLGEVVTRINALSRLLTSRTASSFCDKHEVYLIFTELAVEAEAGRRMIDDGSCSVSHSDDGMATVVNILEHKK
jgi:hypothetical protein